MNGWMMVGWMGDGWLDPSGVHGSPRLDGSAALGASGGGDVTPEWWKRLAEEQSSDQ